jgi:glucose dehydrogenase
MTAEPAPPKNAARDPFELLFVGTHGYVVAIHRFTGKEVWRASLPGTGWSIVSMLVEDGVLYAATKGHVFALDPATGEIFWENALPGLGNDHACLATMRARQEGGAQPLPQAEADADARRHSAH